MNDNFEHQLKTISFLISEGFNAAKYCHELIFAEDRKNNINLALTFLNQANTFITSAKAIYVQFSLEGESQELEDFFHQFSVFNKEVLTNVRTGHSHQWSDIEFRRLEKEFNALTDFLNIWRK
jgi:predicted DNA-binding protein|uniref:HEPN domain-containing protein n=1 Tax=Geobacillus sp. (strain Y4.1MC1) TaxID=581103 RepID=A0A7U4DJN4_GEOS0